MREPANLYAMGEELTFCTLRTVKRSRPFDNTVYPQLPGHSSLICQGLRDVRLTEGQGALKTALEDTTSRPAARAGSTRKTGMLLRPPRGIPGNSGGPAKHTEHRPVVGLLRWCRSRLQRVPWPGPRSLFQRRQFGWGFCSRPSQ